jgi:hypothetical protein
VRRLLLPLLILLAVPATASAKTFCVNAPACQGDAVATIKAGVDAAKNSAGRDRLEIGEGVYPGGLDNTIFVATENPIDIVGAGRGKTIIEGWRESIYIATIYTAGSTISDLTLRIASDFRNSLGIDLNAPATVERVNIEEKVAKSGNAGIITRGGGTIRDSRITIDPGPVPVNYGIKLTGTAGPGPVSISDVDVSGGYGISGDQNGVGPTDIQRVRVTASTYGMFFRAPGKVTVQDADIRIVKHVDESTGGNGISARTDTGAGPLTVDVRHASVTADNQFARGLQIEMFGGSPVDLNVRDTAVSVTGTSSTDLNIHSLPGYNGVATMRLDHSAWKRNATFDGSNVGDIVSGTGNIDMEKSPAAALIDNGTPGALGAESAFDAFGAPRLVDGDSDGVARRDIGAVEAPAGTNAVPVAGAPMTAPDPPGGTAAPAATPPAAQPVDTPPSTRITKLPTRRRPTVSGVATDNHGIDMVELSVTRRSGTRCMALTAKGKWRRAGKPARGRCALTFLIRAKGTTKWSARLKGLGRGRFEIASRAFDDLGQLEVAPRRRALTLR